MKDNDVTTLLTVAGDGLWHTGASLCQVLGWHERRLRDAAELSNGKIVSAPGCALGYKLANPANKDEYIREVRSRYVSQIRRMEYRLKAMDAEMGYERGSLNI